MSGQDLPRARLRVWLRLLKASRGVEENLRRRFREEFATTLPRFDVMAALAREPDGLRMSDISAQLRVSNGNVTGIVDRLVAEGLARRDAVPGDRRATQVALTTNGKWVFNEQASAHAAWIDELLGGLGPQDTALALDLLDRLSQHDLQEA